MNLILDSILKDKTVQKIAQYADGQKNVQIHGLGDSLKVAVFAAVVKHSMIIITPDSRSLISWRDNLKIFLPGEKVEILPEIDFFEVDAAAKSLNLYAQRISILNKLIRNEKIIVLATVDAAISPVVKPEFFKKSRFTISADETIHREDLISKLVDFGYQRVFEVDSVGQFAIRGEIFDIFPVNAVSPIRLEFFDELVESIRIFDINSKRSIKAARKVEILPINLNSEKTVSFIDYLSGGAVIFDDFIKLAENTRQIFNEYPEAVLLNFDSLIKVDNRAVFFLSILPRKVSGVEISETINFSVNAVPVFQPNLNLIIPEIQRWLQDKYKIVFAVEKSQKDKLVNFLQSNNIRNKNISFAENAVTQGFILPSVKLAVISSFEVFGKFQRKIVLKNKSAAENFFSEISPGDYVVHQNHGIGKFIGVVSMEVGGTVRDYVHIQYRGTDKIFLPTDQLQSLQKYIAVGDAPPKLSRLNSAEWSKAKSKAKAAAEDIAEKLIDIYARRGYSQGFAFAADDAIQAEFEDTCEFELTEDQARTLEEVKADMESEKPMDRLVCGDVGFGKTEIAIRAAFKAAMNGKQVAVLVPTTVLAYQHYLTFSRRFEKFLPSVDLLSRFRSAAEQNDTIKRLAAGKLDILIGTHAILNSNRVNFKDLGLLIIDEEQRFGVKQKEKFRDLSSGVDVLSLSATPIPRSLHMSMVGARDLSVIETPPSDRIPIQTYVVESDDGIISDAIQRELNRNGQVFFVYNRIETIEEMQLRLHELVPEARIAIAHGQMQSEVLEQIMMDFYEGKFDILLTTTIIENGLDISNANTIIVYNADYFGLAQLYQLRGRVGRSNRLAFAYFLFKPNKILTEDAEKRLQAIKDFAQLGSSFNIAMRDLQIRGAGNLLGAQQHGHIAGVGFAMYSRLLQEAMNALRGKKLPEIKKVEEFIPALTLNVDAFFDDKFIADSQTKLTFYQKLVDLEKISEINDFALELRDRFGKIPQNAQNLINLAKIKILAKRLKIAAISDRDAELTFQFDTSAHLKPGSIGKLNERFKENLNLLVNRRMVKVKITSEIRKNLLPTVLEVLMLMR